MAAFEILNKEQLSEYDLIVCLDKSGSMGTNEGGKTRWQRGEEFVRAFSEFAAEVDDDGITFITFGGPFDPVKDVHDGVTADKVHDIFQNEKPTGATPLHSALEQAVAKHFSSSKKTIVITAIDGEPNDKNAVQNVIVNAASKLDDPKDLRFLFVQLGRDPGASKYLDYLDDDLVKQANAKFDIVDAISIAKAESMTYEEMLSKALVD